MRCEIKGIEIHYEEVGRGKPIVMLHGFSLDHRVMVGCMEPVFSKRGWWRRIYPDLPGMGKTRGADWISNSEGMLDLVLQFIDEVVGEEGCALVGESYGGYLALGAVHRKPEVVKGLLLICPVVIADPSGRSLPSPATIYRDPELSLDSGNGEMFESIAVVQDKVHWQRFQEEVVPGMEAADSGFLEALHADGYPFSFDVNSTRFSKPTLLLLGRQDSVVGYMDALELAGNYPRGTIAVLDRAGHDLQIEQQGLFDALVEDWLARVESES
jgi:pimeloyl-ACP methyl ester carboxylesterase